MSTITMQQASNLPLYDQVVVSLQRFSFLELSLLEEELQKAKNTIDNQPPTYAPGQANSISQLQWNPEKPNFDKAVNYFQSCSGAHIEKLLDLEENLKSAKESLVAIHQSKEFRLMDMTQELCDIIYEEAIRTEWATNGLGDANSLRMFKETRLEYRRVFCGKHVFTVEVYRGEHRLFPSNQYSFTELLDRNRQNVLSIMFDRVGGAQLCREYHSNGFYYDRVPAHEVAIGPHNLMHGHMITARYDLLLSKAQARSLIVDNLRSRRQGDLFIMQLVGMDKCFVWEMNPFFTRAAWGSTYQQFLSER